MIPLYVSRFGDCEVYSELAIRKTIVRFGGEIIAKLPYPASYISWSTNSNRVYVSDCVDRWALVSYPSGNVQDDPSTSDLDDAGISLFHVRKNEINKY